MKLQILYTILIALRFIATLQRGYIHPDEFFQGGQELFFGCSSTSVSSGDRELVEHHAATKYIHFDHYYETAVGGVMTDHITATWEFEADNALRSIIPPTIMTILPLKLYHKMRNQCRETDLLDDDNDKERLPWIHCFTGWEILVVPRLFMAFMSILSIDIPIWYIARQRRKHDLHSKDQPILPIPIEVLIFASSWVTFGFINRPFSNVLETMCLAILCMIVVYDYDTQQHPSYVRWVGVPSAMGIIGSLGLFTRFTFAIFALPVVLAMIFQRYRAASEAGFVSKQVRMKLVLLTVLSIGIPFFLTSTYIAYNDAILYTLHGSNGKRNEGITLKDTLQYLTPWNAFRYNSNVGNLSEHGLHPRITHALVNFPMLYGPLAICFFLSPILKKNTGNFKSSWDKARQIDIILYGVLIFGLGVLSCAPHQEPRFLLPLVLPLVLLKGRVLFSHPQWKKILLCFWVGFNILLMIFFCGLHQSAVIPSLLALPSISPQLNQQLNAIIYYHTYMPPTFLTRNRLELTELRKCHSTVESGTCDMNESSRSMQDICGTVPIIDLQGASESELVRIIDEKLSCSNQNASVIRIVAPKITLANVCGKHFICNEMWSAFQIATEDMPDAKENFLENSKLSIYDIMCQ